MDFKILIDRITFKEAEKLQQEELDIMKWHICGFISDIKEES